MKRGILLLLAVLFLLTACDLRNRQSSEDFVPTGTEAPGTAASWISGNDNEPFLPQERSAVKTVLAYDGEIPLTQPAELYSYRLPMIDLDGAQAVGCNLEIEERYGALIDQSLQAMERYEDPILQRLSYTSYVIGEVLTLRVDRLDLDGSASSAWYTVNAKTGEEVSVAMLFAAAGIEGDQKTVIADAVTELFVRHFGTANTTSADSPYSTALFKTQDALSPLSANRMHLTEAGRLTVKFELFSPNGGSTIEELVLP